MHNHIAFTYCTRYMCIFFSEIGIQIEKGFAPDKSFRKTFGEKEYNSNGSEFSKNLKSQISWQSRVSPDEFTNK